MNQGREFSIPWEKGVTQNGNVWMPSTPDKPVLPRSNNAQSEVPQDQMGEENWLDLVDMYGEILSNKKPHKFDLNTTVDPNYRDHTNQGIDPVEIYTRLQQNSNPTEIVGTNIRMQNSQVFAPVEVYQRLPLNYSPTGCSGVSNVEHNSQDVSILQKFGNLNQNAGKVGSYAQNLSEVVPPQKINFLGEVVPPQKVTSLAELVGTKSAMRDLSSNGSLNRSTNSVGKPTTTCPLSQVEQNQEAYGSVGARFQQSHIFHESNQAAYATVGAKLEQSRNLHVSHDDSRYNLEDIPNGRLPVPNYNLSLPPRSEAGESSSTARPLPLGPVTPDQKRQSKPHQIIQVPHLFIDEVSTQEKCMQDNVLVHLEPEILERDHNDISPNPMGTSSAAISTSIKEMNNCDGGNGEIDLNKTPQQKIPKRRKHRPKVVVEGKPKRSSKPAVAKVNTPDGDPPTKKKYVRKNGINKSTPPPTDAAKVAEASDVGPPTKSCKRKLNFDMGNGAVKESPAIGLDHQEQSDEGSKLPFDLNFGFHNEEFPIELNGPPTSVGLKAGHENAYGQEKQQTQTVYNFVHSTNEIPPQESMPLVTTVPPPSAGDHALNILARILNARNANVKQCTDQSKYNQVGHHINGGVPQLFFQKNTSDSSSCYRTQSAVQNMPQVLEDLVDVSEKQGTKRGYTHNVLRNQHAIDLMGSQVWPHGVSDPRYCNRNSSLLWQNGSEMGKKNNVEGRFHGTSSSTHAGITTVQDFPWQTGSRMNQSFHAQSSTAHLYGESAYSDCRRQACYRNPNDESTKVSCDHYMNYPDVRHKFQQQQTSSQVHLYSEIMTPKTSHDSANTQITKFIAAVTNRDLESASLRGPKPIPINKNKNSPVRMAANRQTARQTTSQRVSVVDNFLQQEPKIMGRYRQSSKKIAGTQEERRNSFSIDDITNCMKDLQITDNGKEVGWKERSALVPYRGDGAVVPYEDFKLVKKRPPRPRVDLDPETNRLWNILMGKEAGESAETMDNNREKWWEEERKVFRGRVDSFIARMHLVQGDRRFSKWKGSVVDSVIGVFLTQNVSDHLSSSAFMSLAAKFPLKSTTLGQPCSESGGGPSVEHHEVRITYPDGTTFCDKMVKEPVYGHSSVISTKVSEYRAENVMPEKRTEEDIISSQSSSESFVLQASEDIRSSSGSNSDAEGGWNLNKNLGHVNVSEQTENFAASQQYHLQSIGNSNPSKKPLIGPQQLEKEAYSQSPGRAGISSTNSNPFISKTQHDQSAVLQSTNSWLKMGFGMQNWEADGLASFGKERTSTMASKDSDITNETGVECKHYYIGQSADSAFTISQGGRPKSQPSSVNQAVLNKCFELQTESLNESYKRNDQHFIKHIGGKQEAIRQESILIDPRRPAEASSAQQSENSKHGEAETEMRLEHSSDKPSSKISATTLNARKRKAEKEKAEPFNWDTLRKQVQSKSGTIKRSREAMDSMDYEAILNADVREISDAIKERGMNNLLAERMKDFLDRLVQDHERVDLEWLRDVDPEKTKDYLLSIRGLGLKSVECIRLLTLHHLAFPVDTNVGRIAVRLGWVPLQPLPESLQLHLLELYPVLESIQKYLWPRLCKLDQETLYELHYQMITFGKVFCTKREPNCNACPMRGECRHFASAFASARLSLPAPQERHIVSSAAPFSAHKSAEVTIKPMALPPSEDNIVRGKGLTRDSEPLIEEMRGKGLTRDCEPLIEEPTTPESPTEEAERDIEDAFYDDPDEIPVIKLDVKEFTTNLQSFIQEHKEMGEGDMSRALVALSPGLASIPVPKLKNINRLRTEHQVYELPDSHPLLKGMDRREPDDPSPYLLAIWTPGETADSIQPPESRCSSMEGGGLCDKATCFSCSSTREAQAQTVRGTILIPCRTAMRGSFPLNGTYFQVNEVFADHESSLNPIDVPRSFLWNLPRRTVFFGSSVTSIFKGLSTEGIQYCFWKGFVCVRGFDQKNRAPRPLKARLHFPASKMAKRNELR